MSEFLMLYPIFSFMFALVSSEYYPRTKAGFLNVAIVGLLWPFVFPGVASVLFLDFVTWLDKKITTVCEKI